MDGLGQDEDYKGELTVQVGHPEVLKEQTHEEKHVDDVAPDESVQFIPYMLMSVHPVRNVHVDIPLTDSVATPIIRQALMFFTRIRVQSEFRLLWLLNLRQYHLCYVGQG